MNYQKIPNLESTYKTGQVQNFTLHPFALPFPGKDEKLKGYTCRPAAGYQSYYFNSKCQKEKIVLHHTVGHLGSDLQALSRKNYHVSVAFVIARNGTIYQMHNSEHWSYHLGPNALGGNQMQSKKSIGIELSNYGYLLPKGDDLETYYSRRNGNPTDVYCSKEETEQYVYLDKPYRGYQYYASFSNTQYESLVQLLRYLTVIHNIPRTFLSEAERYETTPTVIDFKGITSHVNFRSDKYDIGSAFDWERVILGVQKESPSISMEAATATHEAAEANFQKIQLQVWDIGGEGKDETLDKALREAEEELVKSYEDLEKVKGEISSDKKTEIKEKSTGIVFSSEQEIDEAYPALKSRSIIDYGIDGPKELEKDEFVFGDKIKGGKE